MSVNGTIIASDARYGYDYYILVIDDSVGFSAEVSEHLDNFHASGDSDHIEAEMFFGDHKLIDLHYFDNETEFQTALIQLTMWDGE